MVENRGQTFDNNYRIIREGKQKLSLALRDSGHKSKP